MKYSATFALSLALVSQALAQHCITKTPAGEASVNKDCSHPFVAHVTLNIASVNRSSVDSDKVKACIASFGGEANVTSAVTNYVGSISRTVSGYCSASDCNTDTGKIYNVDTIGQNPPLDFGSKWDATKRIAVPSDASTSLTAVEVADAVGSKVHPFEQKFLSKDIHGESVITSLNIAFTTTFGDALKGPFSTGLSKDGSCDGFGLTIQDYYVNLDGLSLNVDMEKNHVANEINIRGRDRGYNFASGLGFCSEDQRRFKYSCKSCADLNDDAEDACTTGGSTDPVPLYFPAKGAGGAPCVAFRCTFSPTMAPTDSTQSPTMHPTPAIPPPSICKKCSTLAAEECAYHGWRCRYKAKSDECVDRALISSKLQYNCQQLSRSQCGTNRVNRNWARENGRIRERDIFNYVSCSGRDSKYPCSRRRSNGAQMCSWDECSGMCVPNKNRVQFQIYRPVISCSNSDDSECTLGNDGKLSGTLKVKILSKQEGHGRTAGAGYQMHKSLYKGERSGITRRMLQNSVDGFIRNHARKAGYGAVDQPYCSNYKYLANGALGRKARTSPNTRIGMTMPRTMETTRRYGEPMRCEDLNYYQNHLELSPGNWLDPAFWEGIEKENPAAKLPSRLLTCKNKKCPVAYLRKHNLWINDLHERLKGDSAAGFKPLLSEINAAIMKETVRFNCIKHAQLGCSWNPVVGICGSFTCTPGQEGEMVVEHSYGPW